MAGGDKSNGSVRINRYEQEVNRADMDTAAALARTLNVPLAYLFAEDDEQAELLLMFSKLTKRERTEILGQTRKLADLHEAQSASKSVKKQPEKS